MSGLAPIAQDPTVLTAGLFTTGLLVLLSINALVILALSVAARWRLPPFHDEEEEDDDDDNDHDNDNDHDEVYDDGVVGSRVDQVYGRAHSIDSDDIGDKDLYNKGQEAGDYDPRTDKIDDSGIGMINGGTDARHSQTTHQSSINAKPFDYYDSASVASSDHSILEKKRLLDDT